MRKRGTYFKLSACLVLSAALFVMGTASVGVYASAAADCGAYMVMERETFAVLRERDPDVRLPMASTTKIMTALVICEDCDMDAVVTVPDAAVGVEGSSIYLKKGETIDIRDLLYGLMLRSGNDAAAALAVIHSGSTDAFVEKMNERAAMLGARDTHFCNPSGLPDEDHYTTARDLCTIACAAMSNARFREVVGTKSWHGKFRSYENKNKTLYRYDGATGIKTGYTKKAGRCLVSSAVRNGMEVICVVLDCGNMYEKSFALLDDCFKSYELCEISSKKVFDCGGRLCRVNGCKFVKPVGSDIEYRCVPYGDSGDIVGKLEIYLQKDLIFTTDLYSIV